MKEQFPTFRRARRRLGGCGRWLLSALLVLVVVLGVPWTILNIKYGREVEKELAALRAAGKPLTLVEATARSVPEGDNAAPLYQEVFDVNWNPKGGPNATSGLGEITGEQLKDIADYLKQEAPTPQFRSAVLHGPPLEPVVEKLRQASLRPHAVFPVNWQDGPGALFPHLSKFREASRLVAFWAQCEAVEGRGDEALDTLGIGVRMAGHAAEDPTLINQLVAYTMDAIVFEAAQRCLDLAPASPEALRRLAEALRQRKYRTAFVRGMEGERTMALDAYNIRATEFQKTLTANSGVSSSRPLTEALVRFYASPLGAPWRKLDELYYIRSMKRSIELANSPYRETKDALDRRILPATARTAEPYSDAQGSFYDRPASKLLFLAGLFSPVFGRASQKCDWAEAHNGLTQTALALKAYQRQHGSYPESLAGLPWATPVDPFSGKAFVYRREGAGFRLYSLGPDLEDSGGKEVQTGPRAVPVKSPSGWDGDVVWVSER